MMTIISHCYYINTSIYHCQQKNARNSKKRAKKDDYLPEEIAASHHEENMIG
tara:strand:- start:7333 stop:7488 length:156 start_codon:yes stop_codon:yes gene_type:complete